MIADLPDIISKYRSKGILLDTNLLLFLYVGLLGTGWIGRFKRIANHGFTNIDYLLLERAVDSAKVITTPHILTETTNFIFHGLKGDARKKALQLIDQTVQSFKESRPEAKRLVKTEAFLRFGLTDSAILDLPPKRYLVLTVDAPLVIALQNKGVDVVNFNHLRQVAWES